MRTLAVIAVALSLAACAASLKYRTASSAKAPGADATIEATINKDVRQTHFTVNAVNLPPPERVVAGSRFFVGWYRKNTASSWLRTGNLQYDDSSRKGTGIAVVPETEFDYEVTVERDDSTATPSDSVVFSQHVGPAL